MASVDWTKKCHGGTESKNIIRHNDKEMRLQDNHSNVHIDKSRTHMNWQMYEGYNATCTRLSDKLDELDRVPGAHKRSNRVTMQCLEYPAPAGLPDDKFHEWHMKVLGILKSMYGDDLYIVNSYEHYDEVHEYRRAHHDNVFTSRIHAHDCFVPLKDGKLNGKACSVRKNIKKLNNAIQEMTKKDYGLDFMTGEKTKSPKTVEELKVESEIQEIKAEAIEKVEAIMKEKEKPATMEEFFEYMKDKKFSNGRSVRALYDRLYQEFVDLQIRLAKQDVKDAVNQVLEQHGIQEKPDVTLDVEVKKPEIPDAEPHMKAKKKEPESTPKPEIKRMDYASLRQQFISEPIVYQPPKQDDDDYGL